MGSHQLYDVLDDNLAVLLPASLVNAINSSVYANAHGGSPIETIPCEILQMVMRFMDLETLLAFIRASKTTHAAYKQAKALILHGIVEHTVGKELLPIVVNCFMAGSLRGLMWCQRPAGHNDNLPYYDPNATLEFIEHYISKQAMTLTLHPARFGIFEATRMVSIHKKLLRLTHEALRVYEGRYWDRNHQFVQYTREEMSRVLKALYLFEIVHLIVSPALTPLDADPRDRKVRNAFWKRFAPWDFEQMTHVVQVFMGPMMMRTADHHAAILKHYGYQSFHQHYDLRCGKIGRYDATKCSWHRITRPIRRSTALSMLFQHGIDGFLKARESCYEYLKIDKFTTPETWVDWPNIESLFLRAGVDTGVKHWVACSSHYPWSVTLPSQIEQRVKILERTFKKQDDCVFLAWLWRVIFHNCHDPELLLYDGVNPVTLVEGPHDMIFRSTGSMSFFGASLPFPAWEKMELLRDQVD